MKVICTEKSQILATSLARALKSSITEVKYSRFPDGEHYLITGELDDETVIVGSVVDNDALVQLLLIIDACDSSTNRLVLPYMGYARQDKRFRQGSRSAHGPLHRHSAEEYQKLLPSISMKRKYLGILACLREIFPSPRI